MRLHDHMKWVEIELLGIFANDLTVPVFVVIANRLKHIRKCSKGIHV